MEGILLNLKLNMKRIIYHFNFISHSCFFLHFRRFDNYRTNLDIYDKLHVYYHNFFNNYYPDHLHLVLHLHMLKNSTADHLNFDYFDYYKIMSLFGYSIHILLLLSWFWYFFLPDWIYLKKLNTLCEIIWNSFFSFNHKTYAMSFL